LLCLSSHESSMLELAASKNEMYMVAMSTRLLPSGLDELSTR
jgi:hypothetical protein